MVGQIYQGDISTEDIKSLSLSVGTASADPNDKKLWLVELTGDQLMNLLQEGYQLNPNDNVPNLPYYVASGLKIKFAPLKEDKLESVTLADGSALNPEATYQVALWGWPFEQPWLLSRRRTIHRSSQRQSGSSSTTTASRRRSRPLSEAPQ